MFGTLKSPLSGLLRPSAFASSSRVTLAAFIKPEVPKQSLGQGQIRWKSVLAPRRMKYKKAQKGRVGVSLSIVLGRGWMWRTWQGMEFNMERIRKS